MKGIASRRSKKKSIIALCLSVLLLVTCFPISSFANEGEEPEESYSEIEAEEDAEESEGEQESAEPEEPFEEADDETEEDLEEMDADAEPDKGIGENSTEEVEEDGSEGAEALEDDDEPRLDLTGGEETEKEKEPSVDASKLEEYEEAESEHQVWLHLPGAKKPYLKVDYEPETLLDPELEETLDIPQGTAFAGWMDESDELFDVEQPLEGGTVKLWASFEQTEDDYEGLLELPWMNQIWLHLPGETSPRITAEYRIGDFLEQGLEYNLDLPEESIFLGWANRDGSLYDASQPLDGGVIKLWAKVEQPEEPGETEEVPEIAEEPEDPQLSAETPEVEQEEPDEELTEPEEDPEEDLLEEDPEQDVEETEEEEAEEENQVRLYLPEEEVPFSVMEYQPGDVLDSRMADAVEAPEGMFFAGWLDESEALFDIQQPLEGGVIDLTANLMQNPLLAPVDGLLDGEEEMVGVTYLYPDGEEIDTRYIPKGSHLNPMPMMEELDGQRFIYWYRHKDGKENGRPVPFDFNQAIDEDTVLIAYYDDAHYVYFVTYGTAVSPIRAEPGEVFKKSDITSPNPTRAGYTFSHWTDVPNADEYGFDQVLDSDLTLYAVWIPGIVEYTAVYWIEKENLPDVFDKTDINNYTAIYTQNRADGKAGELKKIEEGDVGIWVTASGFGERIKYYEYSGSNTVQLLGNGSSVVNVFYTRKWYTLEFKLPKPGDNLTATLTVNGNTYTDQDDPYYFRARLGQNITDRYPNTRDDAGNLNITVSTVNGGTTTTEFSQWKPSGLSDNSSNWVSNRNEMSENMVPADGKSGTLTASYSSSLSDYYVQYMVECDKPVFDSDYDTDSLQYIYYDTTKKWYQEMPLHTQFVSTGSISQKELYGMTAEKDGYRTNTKTSGQGRVTFSTSSDSAYKVNDTATNRVFLYSRKQNTVSFNTNGGNAITAVNCKFDLPIYDVAGSKVPTRTGYDFLGWYLDAEFKYPLTEDDLMPLENIILYARWRSNNTQTVSFYDRPGGQEVFVDYIEKGYYVSLPDLYEPGKAVEGLGEFIGWQYYPDGRNDLWDYSFDSPVVSDLVLYGNWTTENFWVRFLFDGGTHPDGLETLEEEDQYNAGQILTIPATNLEKDGYTHVAWQRDIDGRIHYPDTNHVVWGTTNFTAMYLSDEEAFVTITFKPSEDADESEWELWNVPIETAGIILPGADFFETPDGYSFGGWLSSQDSQVYKGGGSYDRTLTGDITFTAQWALRQEAAITFRYYDMEGTHLGDLEDVSLTTTGWHNIPDNWEDIPGWDTSKSYTGLYYQWYNNTKTDFKARFQVSWQDDGDTVDVYLARTDISVSVPVSVKFYSKYGGEVTSADYSIYNESQLAADVAVHGLKTDGAGNTSDGVKIVGEITPGLEENQLALSIEGVAGGFENQSTGLLPVVEGEDYESVTIPLGRLKNPYLAPGANYGDFQIGGAYQGKVGSATKKPEVDFLFSITMLYDYADNCD